MDTLTITTQNGVSTEYNKNNIISIYKNVNCERPLVRVRHLLGVDQYEVNENNASFIDQKMYNSISLNSN
jgi:hypothetical protein